MVPLPLSIEPEWTSLEDLLYHRAKSQQEQNLIFHPLGNASGPEGISSYTLYTQAQKCSLIIRSLDGFEECLPIRLHLTTLWDSILWFWAVLLAGGLPVLSTNFSNDYDQRQKHIQGVLTLLQSPICLTTTESLSLFGESHKMKIHTIESMLHKMALPNFQLALPKQKPRYGMNTCRKMGARQPDSPAVLMFTSGSTGNAKAVCLTHQQVLAAVAGKASLRFLPPNQPFLNWIGLDHVANLLEIHLHAMWLGVGQVHVHAADIVSSPSTFIDLLSHHRVSISFAPNFFLAKLVTSIHDKSSSVEKSWELSPLVTLVSGGEANDVKTCLAVSELLEKYGAPRNALVIGFGMTETCAGSIYNLACPDYDIKNGYTVASVGKCMKGIEARFTTSTNNDIKPSSLAQPNEPGNLEVRGKIVFKIYYRKPEATTSAFTSDGWFRTGDQAMIELAGNLNLVGRVNDVININGVKMLATDVQASIEQALGTRMLRLVCFPSRATNTEQVTVAYVPHESPM